ncbi:MAG: hypothetical protein GWP08_21545 [Nitrospiraceae bacterium]|nr:hypothetical protein [Nitrospiraceae bacterium]
MSLQTLGPLLAALFAAGQSDLVIEPPLDPITGTFAAVAHWVGAAPPENVELTLVSEDGAQVRRASAVFSPDERRASARFDTSGVPDGAYRLVARAGDREAAVRIRLRQGREPLPDTRPFRSRMLWMPMTGCTDEDLDDAVAAGYDTLFTKVAPHYPGPARPIDFDAADDLIRKAQARGMKIVLAWLLWTGLPHGRFYIECEDGSRMENRIDPCWDAAMAAVRLHAERLLDHYMGCADVIAIAPTWGIYGEAGYAAFNAGYSPYTLEKYNRWRIARGEATVSALPSAANPGENVLFHRFRFEYLVSVWGELSAHLRRLEPNGIPVGAWQEIYNGHMYQLALSETPGADFAINEMCFPWGTTYDQSRALGETMGFRFKCAGYAAYRDYYRPLIARKWAEGQQAVGCQLSLDYAEKNYTQWPAGRAKEVAFHQWEDRFASVIRRVRDTPVAEEPAEVAYVQMTYPAACYPDAANTIIDINLYEIVLRMYGVPYEGIPVTRLSRLRAEDLAGYRLILVPGAWYLDEAQWRKLRACGAQVVLTGGVAQFGGARAAAARDGLGFDYGATPGGVPELEAGCPEAVARDLVPMLAEGAIRLPEDLGLRGLRGAEAFIRLGGKPLLAREGRFWFIANRLLYACAFDPARKPPNLSGSGDPSANEADPWGKASSSSPANRFGETLLRNLFEACGVTPRIPDPLPRACSRYLGDHVERVNVTGNIVANQDAEAHTIIILCARPVTNFPCTPQEGRWAAEVTVPPYDFVVLHYGDSAGTSGAPDD